MKAFLTGSRVYGAPRPDSDIDLVVFMDREEAQRLHYLAAQLADDFGETYDEETPGASLRFGNLNLIVCTDESRYRSWAIGTKDLEIIAEEAKPVTRLEAIRCFRILRAAAARGDL